MKTRHATLLATLGVASLLLGGCADANAGAPQVPSDTVIDQFADVTETSGPNGETVTAAEELTLTDEEKQQLRDGNHRVAFVWHEIQNYSQAIQAGAEAVFEDLNIEVVATTGAAFKAADQANQIQSVLQLQPEVILGQAVDPTTGEAAYGPAVDAGVGLVFVDQAPNGFVHGEDYDAIFTGDPYGIGYQAAHALAESIGGKGKIGVIFYDADFHPTNFRDGAFLSTMKRDFPEIEIVAKQGFADPNQTEGIATGMLTQHPDLDGLFVDWAGPAQGAIAALKNAGNSTTKVVTIDLDDTIAADMANDGNIAALITYPAFEFGEAMGMAAAYSILGKEAPEFGVVEPVTVTKSNLLEAYDAWSQKVPQAVTDGLEK